MPRPPLFLGVDAVTVPVPTVEAGLAFYRDGLGHPLLWRHDALGQAGLGLGTAGTELVLSVRESYAPTWLVESADDAASAVVRAGGQRVAGVRDLPVGRLAVVADPFDNHLVVLDLSKGRYLTDDAGRVIGVR